MTETRHDTSAPGGLNRRTFLQLGAGVGLVLTLPAGRAFAQGADTLTVAIPADLGGWDQDFLAFDTIGLAVMKNTYPYMIDYPVMDLEGGQVFETEGVLPLYAESFEPNEDGTVWTLKLKQGIKFPSGNELTAADVKWSKDRAFAAQANVAGIYRILGLTEPDQVKVVDDYTVEFTQGTASAMSTQIQIISLYVYDSELLKSHATDEDPWAKEWANVNPIDGGAYNVTEYRPGEEIVLEANPEFPGEAPGVKTIRLQVIPSAANRRLLLQNGDVDVALALPLRDVMDMSEAEGVKLLSAPNNQLVFVPMNTTIAPFDNPAVRKAMAKAVPYDALIKSVYFDEARRVKSVLPLEMPGYSEAGYPFDTDFEAAKSELAEAGFPDGFETSIVIVSGDTEAERIAVLLQNAFGQVGVTLNIENVDPATMQTRRQEKSAPLQVAAGQFWVNDFEYLGATALSPTGFLNYANYNSEKIAELLGSLAGVLDEETRMGIIDEAQSVLAEDVPWLVLAQPNFMLPVTEGVEGWVQPVDGLFRLRYLTA